MKCLRLGMLRVLLEGHPLPEGHPLLEGCTGPKKAALQRMGLDVIHPVVSIEATVHAIEATVHAIEVTIVATVEATVKAIHTYADAVHAVHTVQPIRVVHAKVRDHARVQGCEVLQDR